MAKDINKEPYGEATLMKLGIFEQYLSLWLPVFIQNQYISKVTIYDFCAGSGQDVDGEPGSPLRILRTIDKYRDLIIQKDVTVDVILNEAEQDKLEELQAEVDNSFDEAAWKTKVTVSCYCKKFQQLFREQYEQLKQQPNLLFIDQYGIKEINGEIFKMLINLQKTDFLFFISSSAMKRFASTPAFKAHFPDIDSMKVADAKHEDIHRIMLAYYKEKIPKDSLMIVCQQRFGLL